MSLFLGQIQKNKYSETRQSTVAPARMRQVSNDTLMSNSRYLTPEEYLTWERKQPFKNEYHDGQIIAMSGASRPHNRITVDITVQLSNQLMGADCEVFSGDMRVRTNPTVSYFYPDIIVVCGEPRFEDDIFDTLLNPILVVEVLSPSTAGYDRGEKFEHYKQLASLQDRVHVEGYRLHGTRWLHKTFQCLEDVLSLASIECEGPLCAIYRRVALNSS